MLAPLRFYSPPTREALNFSSIQGSNVHRESQVLKVYTNVLWYIRLACVAKK